MPTTPLSQERIRAIEQEMFARSLEEERLEMRTQESAHFLDEEIQKTVE